MGTVGGEYSHHHYSNLFGAADYSSSSPGYRSLNQNATLSNHTTSTTPTNSVTAQYVSCNPPPPTCKTPVNVTQLRNFYQSSPTDAVRTSPAKMLANMKPDPYGSTMMYHTMQVTATCLFYNFQERAAFLCYTIIFSQSANSISKIAILLKE